MHARFNAGLRPSAAALMLCVLVASTTLAAVRYVNVNSFNPQPPFTDWATAATNIQDAVDAAVAGDEIVVTNGVYATGGRAVYGMMTNRVAVDKPLTVRSVNGPEFTVIQGRQVPGTTNGDGAIRCVYLTNGAVLSGFTLTNGATRRGWESSREHAGGGVWCDWGSTLVSNCTFAGNSASGGGGACSATLYHCVLLGNSAGFGGGAIWSTLNQCTLTGNSADYGGGAWGCTLDNCMLTDNRAYESGGGTSSCGLSNCVLSGNSATGDFGSGGGAAASSLNNCTLTGNSATYFGGGTFDSMLNNCILYYNTALSGFGDNYYSNALYFCCTTPLPSVGESNITLDPQLASASHLSATSPCRGAGSRHYAVGADIDGEAWGNPPSIGCDEYRTGAVTGPLKVDLTAAWTNVAAGYAVNFRALIAGRASASAWDFGDGVVVSNRPFVSHAWSASGAHAVVLRAWNESNSDGVSATVMVQVVSAPVHYVAAENASPAWPFASRATAARTVQEAVDAAVPGALVLVSNGVYATGGRAVYGTMTNRVVVDKPVVVRSVNGPGSAVIQGHQVPGTINGEGAVRCVYLASGAMLSGFTLTNGATQIAGEPAKANSGGAVYCELPNAVVSNCTIIGNSAFSSGGGVYRGRLSNCRLAGNSAFEGGGGNACALINSTLTGNSAYRGAGAYSCTLNNCVLSGNSAFEGGGGAYSCTLSNCVVVGNSATGDFGEGGGVYESALHNCVLYYNTAESGVGPNYARLTYLSYCCTTPLPEWYWGSGNITNAPLFVDRFGGNLRLQSNSPCINAGHNAFVIGDTDLDGQPRIAGGTVDIGAYEFQSPASQLSYAWLQHYGLSTDGSADFTDPDGDRLNNWQEWRCGTVPTDASSALRLLAPQPLGTNLLVRWESVSDRIYFLEHSTNLSSAPTFLPLATNLSGRAGTTAFTDTNGTHASQRFYRVGVE